jgi:hypothetical protein
MKIFCAETLWDRDVSTTRTSYENLLKLVSNETGDIISYFTFNTPEELDHLFTMFKESKYDLFYIASHMRDGNVTSGYKSQFITSIPSIIKRNRAALSRKILHLAGCSSMSEDNINIAHIKKICKLKAISGYTIDTDSTESAAMDLLYLATLSKEGLEGLPETLNTRYKSLVEASGFKMYILKEVV